MIKGSGFNPNNRICVHDILSTDISDGGIFTFSEADRENIKRINFRGKDKWSEKAVDMVVYLLDIVLDILISSKNNVLSSPGFKVIFGAIV